MGRLPGVPFFFEKLVFLFKNPLYYVCKNGGYMKHFCQQNGYQNLMSVMGVGPKVKSSNTLNNYRLTSRGVNTWPVKFCEALAHFENFSATFRNIHEAIKQLYKSDTTDGTYNNVKAVLHEAKFVSYNNSTKLWTLTDFGKAWLLWVNGAEVGPVLAWLGQEGEPCDYKVFRSFLHIYDSEIRKDESHYQKPTKTYTVQLTKDYTIEEFLNFIGGLLTHNEYVTATTHSFINIKNNSGKTIKIGSIEVASTCTAKIRTASDIHNWKLLNPEEMLSPELKMALGAYKKLNLGDRLKFLEMSQDIPCKG